MVIFLLSNNYVNEKAQFFLLAVLPCSRGYFPSEFIVCKCFPNLPLLPNCWLFENVV
jgi:hypothetical protein